MAEMLIEEDRSKSLEPFHVVPLESPMPDDAAIAAEAYALYAARGYEDGHDVEDWLAAEEMLRARHTPDA